jgi:hypothetical protein
MIAAIVATPSPAQSIGESKVSDTCRCGADEEGDAELGLLGAELADRPDAMNVQPAAADTEAARLTASTGRRARSTSPPQTRRKERANRGTQAG